MIGIHENGELRALNNGYTLGSGGGSGTPIPTADTNAQFDSDAHMNSTDMTSQEVEDFVDNLNVGGSGSSRTLLWTNPTPTLNFAEQDILTTTDFTQYDEIEVVGINYVNYGSIMPSLRLRIGEQGNLIGLAGSSGDSTGTGFLVARGVKSYTNKLHFYSAAGVATNSSSWSVNNNNMIPLHVYGISY